MLNRCLVDFELLKLGSLDDRFSAHTSSRLHALCEAVSALVKVVECHEGATQHQGVTARGIDEAEAQLHE